MVQMVCQRGASFAICFSVNLIDLILILSCPAQGKYAEASIIRR